MLVFNNRRATAAFVLLTLAVMLAYGLAWKGAPYMTLDSPSYMRLAADIAGGHLTQLHQRTPGLPLVLALTGSESHPTRVLFYLFLALHCVSAFLLWSVLSSLRISRFLQILFVCVALLPPYVEAAASPDTEALSEFTLVVAFVALVRWVSSGSRVSGIVFALSAAFAALVRPTYQAITVVLAVVAFGFFRAGLFSPRHVWGFAGGLVAAIGLSGAAIGGWSYMNYLKFGYFDTSTMSAINITTRTADFVECMPPQWAGMRDILVRYRNTAITQSTDEHIWQDYVYRALPELEEYFHHDDVMMYKTLKTANIALIKEKPFSYLNESLRALGPYWMPFDVPLSSAGSSRFRALWAALQVCLTSLFWLQLVPAGGVLVLCLSWKAGSSALAARLSSDTKRLVGAYGLGLVFIVYSALVSCFMGIGISRYRVPVEMLGLTVSLMGYTLWSRVIAELGQIARLSADEPVTACHNSQRIVPGSETERRALSQG